MKFKTVVLKLFGTRHTDKLMCTRLLRLRTCRFSPLVRHLNLSYHVQIKCFIKKFCITPTMMPQYSSVPRIIVSLTLVLRVI